MPTLSFDDISERLKTKFGENVLGIERDGDLPCVRVEPYVVAAVARHLRDDADLAFDFLQFVTAVDWPATNKITVVYNYFSYPHRHALVVKADVDRAGGHLPTVTPVYAGADWHEREVFDLFGVTFDGHPDLRRILMPEDYTGHPLLKDFQSPDYVPFPETKNAGK